MRIRTIPLCLLFAAGTTFAQVSVPNTFTPGAAAKAADVNANFQALAAAINAQGARLARLEGQVTAADLAGTYTLRAFETELRTNEVHVYTSLSTLTLAANGTGTLSAMTESGNKLDIITRTVTAVTRSQAAQSITWSYSGGVLTVLDQSFAVAAGGTVLTASSTNGPDGSSIVLLATRR